MTKRYFVDSNVFLRMYDRDDLKQNAKQSYPDSYIAITAQKLNAGVATFKM